MVLCEGRNGGDCCRIDRIASGYRKQRLKTFGACLVNHPQQECRSGFRKPIFQVGRIVNDPVKPEAGVLREIGRCRQACSVNLASRNSRAFLQEVTHQIGVVVTGARDAIEQPGDIKATPHQRKDLTIPPGFSVGIGVGEAKGCQPGVGATGPAVIGAFRWGVSRLSRHKVARCPAPRSLVVALSPGPDSTRSLEHIFDQQRIHLPFAYDQLVASRQGVACVVAEPGLCRTGRHQHATIGSNPAAEDNRDHLANRDGPLLYVKAVGSASRTLSHRGID